MESTLLIDLLKLGLVLVLVAANGFFVAAEFSLVSVRRTRIAELVEQGNVRARDVQEAIANPDSVIAATQLGITLASLGLGWVGEPALSHFLEPVVHLFPITIQSEVSHSIAAGLSFAIITFMHVVAGELAPKSVALQNPEGTSLVVARPTLWTEVLFKPAIIALNGAGNMLLRLFGIEPVSGHEMVHSVEELKMLVEASTEGGVVEKDEGEMLHAIFDFGELLVEQVMIPRTEIVAVEADASLQATIQRMVSHPYTKFPVYEENLDQILGVLHARDVIAATQDPARQHCVARDLVREALFVPQAISVNRLLQEFRARRQHIAIVLDEYGGTAGLVTLEDLLEEIVGEVSGPFDEQRPEIQPLADGQVLIDGLTLIDDVNEELGLNLEDAHYNTIAGFVLGRLGRIPQVGDAVDVDGVRLEVREMDGLRIARLLLQRLQD
ncbi:MAG: HlyC/CorC family transporter [Anaerolineae bacterium]|nr:MAG: HlyC/CorC family transporter [Anaerolineae bacterium]